MEFLDKERLEKLKKGECFEVCFWMEGDRVGEIKICKKDEDKYVYEYKFPGMEKEVKMEIKKVGD